LKKIYNIASVWNLNGKSNDSHDFQVKPKPNLF
jgi:hypothetical protein